MKKIILFVVAVLFLGSCHPDREPAREPHLQPDDNMVIVQEVLQTTRYTYLQVRSKDSTCWLAMPLTQAATGETCYYVNAMLMRDFHSRELNRTFDAVYFIDGIHRGPHAQNSQARSRVPAAGEDISSEVSMAGTKRSLAEPHSGSTAQIIRRTDIQVKPEKDIVTISQLFSGKNRYAEKIIRVKGTVTRINPGILHRNWIHIQDGTSFENNFDLTVTTTMEVKPDDMVTFEGRISLNKDFGYGYFYAMIMEDAVIK